MENEEIKEVIAALTVIQEVCHKCDDCRDCPMSCDGECLVTSDRPHSWYIADVKKAMYNGS